MFAANYQLHNLVAIIDRNKLQYDGSTQEVAGLDSFADKISAFGWKVLEVDGHSISELLSAYRDTDEKRPLAIVADTVKGKGVSFMENNPVWHHSELSKELYEQAIAEISKEG
jgi:transketolase